MLDVWSYKGGFHTIRPAMCQMPWLSCLAGSELLPPHLLIELAAPEQLQVCLGHLACLGQRCQRALHCCEHLLLQLVCGATGHIQPQALAPEVLMQQDLVKQLTVERSGDATAASRCSHYSLNHQFASRPVPKKLVTKTPQRTKGASTKLPPAVNGTAIAAPTAANPAPSVANTPIEARFIHKLDLKDVLARPIQKAVSIR
jgi:hypothetical protein